MPNCGDKLRWDCTECQSYQLNEKRNCGGKFPQSEFAKKGYQIGPLKLFECPKTFIKRSSIETLRFIDNLAEFKGPELLETKTQKLFQTYWFIQQLRRDVSGALTDADKEKSVKRG